MPLAVWSAMAQVTASLTSDGRIEFFAARRAGSVTTVLLVEAYDADGLVAAGEVAVWELNQALAALMAPETQARRLTLRDDGRGHGGHLDVVCGDAVEVVVTSRAGGRRAAYATTTSSLSADLNGLLRHYLGMQRLVPEQPALVLPDAVSLPAPAPR